MLHDLQGWFEMCVMGPSCVVHGWHPICDMVGLTLRFYTLQTVCDCFSFGVAGCGDQVLELCADGILRTPYMRGIALTGEHIMHGRGIMGVLRLVLSRTFGSWHGGYVVDSVVDAPARNHVPVDISCRQRAGTSRGPEGGTSPTVPQRSVAVRLQNMGPCTNHDTLVMGQEAVRRGGEQVEQYPGTL
jgi:hypothetical protein